jgi:polar amino acid transport system substrate-binding protein
MTLRHLLWTWLAALTLGLVAGSAQVRADALQEILERGTVRIGVPIDVPPFGFTDQSQQPVGLDVDLAKQVAEALGVELELQQITGITGSPSCSPTRSTS